MSYWYLDRADRAIEDTLQDQERRLEGAADQLEQNRIATDQNRQRLSQVDDDVDAERRVNGRQRQELAAVRESIDKVISELRDVSRSLETLRGQGTVRDTRMETLLAEQSTLQQRLADLARIEAATGQRIGALESQLEDLQAQQQAEQVRLQRLERILGIDAPVPPEALPGGLPRPMLRSPR